MTARLLYTQALTCVWLLMLSRPCFNVQVSRALQTVAKAELHWDLANGLGLEVMLKLLRGTCYQPDGC